jgi:hypothetical protein
MTNPFYNKGFDVLQGSSNRSDALEGEFQAVEQGFDAINSQFAAIDAYSTELVAARQGQASLLANLLRYAPLSSPVFTDSPRAPTAAPGDASTRLASTEFVQAAIAAAAAVPGALVDVDVTTTPFNIQNGQRALIKGAMAITINAPAYSDAGRWAFAVCNGRVDNVINWSGANHQGLSDPTMTINRRYAAAEVIGIDATYGWGLSV